MEFCWILHEGHNPFINDQIRGEGVFSKVVKNIISLKDMGYKIIIANTLNKSNYLYINNMIALAAKLGVYAIRFELFIPLGTGSLNNEDLALSAAEFSTIKKQIKEKIKNQYLNAIKVILPVFNSENGCGAGYTSCIINADFTMSPCDMLASDYKTVSISNGHSILQLWSESECFKQWRSLLVTDSICLECSKKHLCNYGCRASALAYTGDIMKGDPLCIHR